MSLSNQNAYNDCIFMSIFILHLDSSIIKKKFLQQQGMKSTVFVLMFYSPNLECSVHRPLVTLTCGLNYKSWMLLVNQYR